jgi:hypothetical protein
MSSQKQGRWGKGKSSNYNAIAQRIAVNAVNSPIGTERIEVERLCTTTGPRAKSPKI